MAAQGSDYLTEVCRMIAGAVPAEKIYLFGSYAYGVPGPDSDYDLMVVLPDEGPRPAQAVKDIRRALCPVQEGPLDIIACRASEFERRKKGATLERRIAREGVLLHERGEFEQRMA